jgi:hypothetical protein
MSTTLNKRTGSKFTASRFTSYRPTKPWGPIMHLYVFGSPITALKGIVVFTARLGLLMIWHRCQVQKQMQNLAHIVQHLLSFLGFLIHLPFEWSIWRICTLRKSSNSAPSPFQLLAPWHGGGSLYLHSLASNHLHVPSFFKVESTCSNLKEAIPLLKASSLLYLH